MNNDKDKNMEWLIKEMVNKAEASNIGNNKTELTFSDEQELQFCDAMVVQYAIDRNICSPSSSLIKHSGKHISENFSNNDCRFITTSVVEKKMNLDPADADLNLAEIKEFYLRNNLKDYEFNKVLSKSAIDLYWGNRQHQRDIMEWRWNNGLAFMNYKERVLTYLSDVVLLNNETEVTKMITKLYSIQSAISILQSDFQTIVDSSLLEKFHPTTRGVIKGFATGRINLDKMAKDAIYHNYLATKANYEVPDEILDKSDRNTW